MTPYGKGQGGSSSPGSAASPGGASPTRGADDYLAERGYIEVVEDVRGTGDSNGRTANGTTVLPYHPYTQASARPVTPGAVTGYQIQVFPTLATIAAGNRLRLTLATAHTPHLVPLPAQLPQLAGGIHTIARSASAPSSLTVETLR